MVEIVTERLVLRGFVLQDAEPMARQIADWDVIKWLTSPPWPYTLADAEWFIGDHLSDDAFAITRNGEIIGVVGGDDDLGYWLGREHWGHGYMTEAAKAALAHRFSRLSTPITSGYVLGNEASRNVLLKLGFQNTFKRREMSTPMGKDVELQRMQLTAERWRARHAP